MRFSSLRLPAAFLTSLLLPAAVFAQATQPEAASATQPVEDAVALRLRDYLAPHPRLLLDRTGGQQLAKRVLSDPKLSRLYQRLLDHADALVKLPPIERKMTGRRMTSAGLVTDRVATCALAYRLTSDSRFFTTARDTMLTVASFDDWNPSHFLDTSETTMGLAIGYDWLYDALQPSDRAAISHAIIEKGLAASFTTPKPMWWVNAVNNWNQVCHGNLVLGALATAGDDRNMATHVITRAVTNLPIAMKQYGPDGAYPEGMAYWAYGTGHTIPMLAGLQTALGTDFGLSQIPGFLKTSQYHLHLVGPTSQSFSYSDSNERAGSEAGSGSAAAFYLASLNQDPSLLFNEATNLDRLLSSPKATADSDHSTWQLLVFAPAGLDRITPSTTHYAGNGPIPVATHRSGWTPNDTFIAIKGGSPSENHAHMDVGSFCLDALGVRWAGDLGMQDYNSLESKNIDLWNGKQDSQRWQVFRLGSLSHNILTVDGQEQIVKGHAPIVKSTDAFTIVNTTPVYAGQLAAAQRGILLRPDQSVRLQDEIRAAQKPATVRWAILTTAKVNLKGSTAVLSNKGKSLTLNVVSPANATLKIVQTDPPPHDYDAPNPDSRLVVFEAKLSPDEAASLVVDFIPGPPPKNSKPTAGPVVTPLADWK